MVGNEIESTCVPLMFCHTRTFIKEESKTYRLYVAIANITNYQTNRKHPSEKATIALPRNSHFPNYPSIWYTVEYKF